MAAEIILPRVDMDMATGQISRWYIEEGASVEKGQLLFEIETDKAAMEIEAPASGILRAPSAPGVQVAVGTTVGWIVAPGEAFEAPKASAANTRPETSARPDAVVPDTEPTAAPAGDGEIRATPLARRLARMHNLALASIQGSGPRGRIQAPDIAVSALTLRADAAPGGSALAAALAPSPAPTLARQEEKPLVARQTEPGQQPALAAAGALHGVWLRPGEGDPLVMVHGFGADLNGWRPLVQTMAQVRPVFAIDLPGHGGSPLDGAEAIETLVDLVASTIEAAGIRSAHLVGHSLGAAISTLVADRAAFEIKSLLLISPAGLGPDINGAFLSGFARSRSEESLAPWMKLLVADERALGSAFIRTTAKARSAGTAAADQERLAAALFPDGTQSFSVRDALARIAAPVRLVTGTADRIIPPHHAAGVPGNVAVHTLAGVGHMPHIEARDLVARILGELVRSAA